VSPALGGVQDSTVARLTAGAVSGVVGSSTSMGGPPVVLYLLGRGLDAPSFRATLLVYFLPGNLLQVIAFAIVGQITNDVVTVCGASLPAVCAVLLAGAWVRRRVQPERFRAVVVAVLVLTSVVVLVSATGALG